MSTPPVNSCNSSAGLIEKYINSAYDNVKAVADNLDYLDQIYQFLLQYGLITNIAVKAPVQAVATSPITLSGNQVLTWSAHSGDYSVLATTGMRVLVLGQTNPVENGIYDVQNNAWIRSVDFDGPKDVVDGTLVFSSQGDVWQVDGPQYSLVPGIDPITFRDIDLFAYEALRGATEKAQEAADSAAAALASKQAAKVSENNAASSKTHAGDSAAAATISETNAKVSENAAKVSENNAKNSQIAAQNSASLAESVTNNTLTFATTAAGIAGTTNGQYFRVPQGSGATLSFIYYLNNSGTAQVVAEMPGKGAITNNIRSYSSLAVAQADVTAGNILNGTYCYVRNSADKVLADEYINNGGTLKPTGRKAPSLKAVDDIAEQTKQTSDGLQRIYLAQQLLSCVMGDMNNDLNASNQRISETVQRLVVSQQVMAEGVNELSTLPGTLEDAQLHALYAISVLGSQLMPLDGIDLAKDGQSSQLATLMAFSVLVNALAPLDGFNPENTGGSGDAGSPLKYPGVYAYGAPRGLIRMDLTTYNRLPSKKDEDPRKGQLKIDIDGEVMNCYVMISVQGSSSASFPKKNLNLKFYPDNTFNETISLKIGDMLPHDELVFKANWIDSTHVRNTMSYNLWDKVEETRKGWPKRDIDNTYVGTIGAAAVDDGATGHPTGYPCILYVDGLFYGIGDFMCGKKRSNYRIAKNSPKQILLGFDGAVNIPELPANGTYEVKAPSKPNADTEEALNLWRSFAQSPQAEFTANRDIHLDKNNIVDFYVFLCFICAPDCTQKNTQFLTWDGVKWYFMPYDLDTTYGLHYAGTSIEYPPTLNLFNNGLVMWVNRTFWNKVLNAYRTEINARYKELRDLGVFSVDMVYNLARDLQSKYTAEMFAAEYAKWPNVPSLQLTSLDQILNWTKDRIDYLDGFFSYTK